MKKTLIALATLAAAGTAFAQSTATISGSISVGVMDTGKAGGTAAVSTLGGGANAIDIVTREDLGGGMNAGFTSQIRFNANTGDVGSAGTGNALFHAANVYVGGGFGTIRVGKIAEASNCSYDAWGCTGGAGMMAGHATTAGHDSSGISALIGAAAIANSVSYTTPTINGFSASYQSTVSTRVNERSAFALNYAKGPLTAQVLRTENTANAAANATFNTSGAITDGNGRGTSIAASYDFGVARLNVFNAKTDPATVNVPDSNPTRDITFYTASMPMGA
jgi:hypothetical protein